MAKYKEEASSSSDLHCHLCSDKFKTLFVLKQHMFRHYKNKFIREIMKDNKVIVIFCP